MKTKLIAFAAALALPLPAPALSQVPAELDLLTARAIAGTWTYQPLQGGSQASFVDASKTQRLLVRCNRTARSVSIVRTGVAAAAPSLSVWTTSSSRSVPSRYLPTKELAADLAAADPLLDSIAFSRGRFATAAAGAPMVVVPSSAEVARVVEDCRS